MPILNIEHPDLRYQPRTFVSSALAASGATITVENSTGFTASDAMVIGGVGEEKTEEILVHASTSITSTTIPTVAAAVVFAHSIGTPITRSDWDQIRIWTATTETGTFTEIAASPIDIDWEGKLTRYNDEVSAENAWFKTQFSHSVDATTGELGDAFQPARFKVRSPGAMISSIRTLLNIKDNFKVISDATLMDMLNISQLALSADRDFPFLETTFTDSTVDSVQTIALPTTMKPGSLTDLNILLDGTNYHPEYVDVDTFLALDIDDGLEVTQDAITHYTIVGLNILLFPVPSASGSSDVTFYGTKVPDILDEQNEQSNFPDVTYFVYDVAHQLAIMLNKQTKILDRLQGEKDRAMVRMMKYGTKQSTGPGRVRRIPVVDRDPSRFWEITT